MFDWSDLFLLLPEKVFWTLLGAFCVMMAAFLLWVKFG